MPVRDSMGSVSPPHTQVVKMTTNRVAFTTRSYNNTGITKC
jgi:hypothetical protein